MGTEKRLLENVNEPSCLGVVSSSVSTYVNPNWFYFKETNKWHQCVSIDNKDGSTTNYVDGVLSNYCAVGEKFGKKLNEDEIKLIYSGGV